MLEARDPALSTQRPLMSFHSLRLRSESHPQQTSDSEAVPRRDVDRVCQREDRARCGAGLFCFARARGGLVESGVRRAGGDGGLHAGQRDRRGVCRGESPSDRAPDDVDRPADCACRSGYRVCPTGYRDDPTEYRGCRDERRVLPAEWLLGQRQGKRWLRYQLPLRRLTPRVVVST